MYSPQRFSHHVQYVATLPCEIRKSINVTEFSHFKNWSTFAKVIIKHEGVYFFETLCNDN